MASSDLAGPRPQAEQRKPEGQQAQANASQHTLQQHVTLPTGVEQTTHGSQ